MSIELPQPPVNLLIKDATATSLTVHWSPPEDDGGAEVTDYVIEMCLRGEDWKPVAKVGITSRHLYGAVLRNVLVSKDS